MNARRPLCRSSDSSKRYGGLVAVKNIELRAARRRDRRPDRSERLRQIDGDEADHGHRARRSPARSSSTASTSRGWPSHRVARAGVGIVFQHSRPLHRQTVLENIKLALLPDSLLRLFADPRRRRARPRHRRARRAWRAWSTGIPATLPFADLRRMETGQSDRARSARWCWSTSPSPA